MLTGAVIRGHKFLYFFKENTTKEMVNNVVSVFSQQGMHCSLTLKGTMELVWVTTSQLKTGVSQVLGCMTILHTTK